MFNKPLNLLNGIKILIDHYSKTSDLPFTDEIAIILYSSELKSFYQFLNVRDSDKFKDTIYNIDEVYSAISTNLTYKDGTENQNTIYGALFSLAIEAFNVFEEELILLED
jgi:hypothetical protein